MNELSTQYAEKLAQELVNTAALTVDQLIEYAVKQKVNSIDIKGLIYESIEKILKQHLDTLVFPARSIPHLAIDFNGVQLSGDNIKGGMYEHFGSTGIDDQASECKLTVMDEYVVVENTLLAGSAKIKNDLTVEGRLILAGEVVNNTPGYLKLVDEVAAEAKQQIERTIVDNVTSATINKISEDGLNVSKLNIDGKTLIAHNTLGPTIVESNLQKLGTLRELNVNGKSSLYNTLYVGSQRVGVNTESPSRAFVVWDEECEIAVSKYEKNTGYLGSVRTQNVVLGSNGLKNIVLKTDGTTEIEKLAIGEDQVLVSSGNSLPNRVGKKGEIVFNSDPQLGRPIGWVCIGESRWAQLGLIQ